MPILIYKSISPSSFSYSDNEEIKKQLRAICKMKPKDEIKAVVEKLMSTLKSTISDKRHLVHICEPNSDMDEVTLHALMAGM